MSLADFLSDARSIVTVLSLLSFIGIVAWAYGARRASAFAEAAMLPFADEQQQSPSPSAERLHG